MFDSFWTDFKWKIFFSCFVPYLLYFCSAFLYIISMLYDKNESSGQWDIRAKDYDYSDVQR